MQVNKVVKEGVFLLEFKDTLIALVPKVKNLEYVKLF